MFDYNFIYYRKKHLVRRINTVETVLKMRRANLIYYSRMSVCESSIDEIYSYVREKLHSHGRRQGVFETVCCGGQIVLLIFFS